MKKYILLSLCLLKYSLLFCAAGQEEPDHAILHHRSTTSGTQDTPDYTHACACTAHLKEATESDFTGPESACSSSSHSMLYTEQLRQLETAKSIAQGRYKKTCMDIDKRYKRIIKERDVALKELYDLDEYLELFKTLRQSYFNYLVRGSVITTLAANAFILASSTDISPVIQIFACVAGMAGGAGAGHVVHTCRYGAQEKELQEIESRRKKVEEEFQLLLENLVDEEENIRTQKAAVRLCSQREKDLKEEFEALKKPRRSSFS